jgi:serine phosphatase RsbU (regulator of sigma subunit)
MLGRGVIPPPEARVANDEIGEMGDALNDLIKGQKSIRKFVNALGSGEFTVHYEPLSDDDELAPDFIKTRDALAENERITEMKITQRTKELEEKNEQINEQSQRVISLYQDLRDSIEYAKRLQDSILPTRERLKHLFPEHFVFYKPKDIVSGDFYWVHQADEWAYIAAVDCTGHGVPGAFMSLIGHNSLNLAMDTADRTDPGSILTELNKFATDSLNRNTGRTKVRDGMDIALCAYNSKTMELRFAGAMRPIVCFQGGEELRYRGDRVSIGSQETRDHLFQSHSIQLQENDAFYIFSDGYPDQFGGKEKGGKKYKQSKFIRDLAAVHSKPVDEQQDALKFNMMAWQEDHAQVDDMLVIGVKATSSH